MKDRFGLTFLAFASIAVFMLGAWRIASAGVDPAPIPTLCAALLIAFAVARWWTKEGRGPRS